MPNQTSKLSDFIQLLIDSLFGKKIDFTTKNLKESIILLAVPMIIEMLMESAFAIVDIYFVGKISVNAVATVALTESVMMLLYAIAIGLSMAATAVVARRIGEKKEEEAAKAGVQSIWIAILVSFVFLTVGITSSELILELMGGEKDLIKEGAGYTAIMLGGNITIMLLFLINAIFRGAGNAQIAMIVLIISNGLNMILDPLFIFGWGPVPAMGIEGAAIATTTGRGIGVLIQVYLLFKGSGAIKVLVKHLVFIPSIVKNVMKIAVGGIGQFMIGTLSWLFLVRISAAFGSEALAGYAIAFRIIMFTILPSWGLANAGATLVGQNLGAKQPQRAEKAVWLCAQYNMYFLIAVAIAFIWKAEFFIEFFSSELEVINVGAQALRYIGFGYIIYSYGMVIGQAFNGAGDTKTPTIINLFCFWLLEIPLAYFLAITLDLGPKGIFSAISITVFVHAITCILVFRRGKWKETVV